VRNFGKVTAYQREVMTVVDVADGADAIHRRLIADLASQRIARVGGIHDQSARVHDLRSLLQQARLWMSWMNQKVLCHGRPLLYALNP